MRITSLRIAVVIIIRHPWLQLYTIIHNSIRPKLAIQKKIRKALGPNPRIEKVCNRMLMNVRFRLHPGEGQVNYIRVKNAREDLETIFRIGI